jgi:hypothetical protein
MLCFALDWASFGVLLCPTLGVKMGGVNSEKSSVLHAESTSDVSLTEAFE